jgi:Immunity protein Imm1
VTAGATYNYEGEVGLTTDEDVDKLIDAVLATKDFGFSVIKIYANDRLNDAGHVDHELSVSIDNEGGEVGGLRYQGNAAPGGYGAYGVGRVSQRDEVFYYHQGETESLPSDSELPIDAIRQAVKEFLASNGELPTSINWAPMPEGFSLTDGWTGASQDGAP